MSTQASVDEQIRELMLVLHRLVGRVKRLPPPEPLRTLELTPRHLSLLSMLVLDGPLSVSELAARLSVAPTTVSLIVAELTQKGVLQRRADSADRRRRIIDLQPDVRPAVTQWLSPGARAWRGAIGSLSQERRAVIVTAFLDFEAAFMTELDRDAARSVPDGNTRSRP